MQKALCVFCSDEIWKAKPGEMPTFPAALMALLVASDKLDPQWRHLADGLRTCQVGNNINIATPSDEPLD